MFDVEQLVVVNLKMLLHAIVSRPKIRYEFTVADTEDDRSLHCNIWNPPITNRLLMMLGAHRRPLIGLQAFVGIWDKLANTTVAIHEVNVFTRNPYGNIDPHFRRSIIAPITFYVDKSLTLTMAKPPHEPVELTPGEYKIVLDLHADGEHTQLSRDCHVGSQKHELYWLSE